MKRFFSVFIFFLIFLTGFPEITSCPGGEKVSARHQGKGKRNELSDLFAQHLKDILRDVLQEKFPGNSRLFILSASGNTGTGNAKAVLKKSGGRFILLIPGDFDSFTNGRKNINHAVSLAFLSALGLPENMAEKISMSFIISAVTHQLSNTFFLQSMPYNNYTPGASVLTANGILPDLEKVFRTPLPPESAKGDLYGEYSSILLSGLVKRKLFTGADFAAILHHATENSTKRQLDIFLPLLRKKLKEKKYTLAENEFFHTLIKRNLSHSLQPLSTGELERRYILLTKFEAEDLSGKKVSFTLPEFAEKLPLLRNRNRITHHLLQELLRLSRLAPGNTGNALLWLRQNIYKAGNLPAEEGKLLICKAEQQFLKELEKQSAIEEFLSSSEKFAVTPGVRFFRTMEVFGLHQNSSFYRPWGSEMEKLLDTAQLFSSGQDDKTFQ